MNFLQDNEIRLMIINANLKINAFAFCGHNYWRYDQGVRMMLFIPMAGIVKIVLQIKEELCAF